MIVRLFLWDACLWHLNDNGGAKKVIFWYKTVVYQLSEIEKKILAALQHGLPHSRTPYKDMAGEVGIERQELLDILRRWKQEGIIRRIGAIVNHSRLGYTAGAMVLWQVGPEDSQRVGELFAGFDEVSHAYQRKTDENWPYNIYTMVHGRDEQALEQIIDAMSKASGVTNYRILTTEKELKKVPPTYITDLQADNKMQEQQ